MLPAELFGQKIRSQRVGLGMTQQQLADLMFVSRRTIINWESGSSLPDISMLSRLAEHLKLETIELLDDMSSPINQPVVIIVESNAAILKSFTQLMIDTLQEAQVYGFDCMSEALRYCSGNKDKVTVAFINVELQGESGVVLARVIRNISPKTNIVFISRNYDYTSDAWRIHASGYVLMPLTAEKIRSEVDNLRFPYRYNS